MPVAERGSSVTLIQTKRCEERNDER
jgi:hypothetical protein